MANTFYLLVLLGFFIVSLFIIYHIVKYSINKNSSQVMLLIFVPVMIFLVLLNIIFFSRIKLEEFFIFSQLTI
ncbi:MAG: hypothetical protein PHH24_02515 [Candidatus Moranbacteria bacterium]|nr:hypothetical protein [Candidatus Moranbacteria bacterium]MDD5652267.1 hypothetical protein [Candidatus Moranbacteria bacterium]MDX9855563.1 hypothetical protein [Candidatus Moranbacteria bacterium]